MFFSYVLHSIHGMLTMLDLALQVLDDVIMTRWKVLPREQCLGKHQESRVLLSAHELRPLRHTKFHRQLHYRKLQVRRKAQE